jgi:hypothetical protein
MTTYKLADMGKWGEKAKRNTTMVMRSSVQKLATDLMTDVGPGAGQVPIDTGNLRNSLMASTASMPSVREGEFGDNSGQVTFAIAGANIGDTIWIGWQAVYAARMNYGFTGTDAAGRSFNQTGRHFVQAKANKWQSYVDAAAAEFVD